MSSQFDRHFRGGASNSPLHLEVECNFAAVRLSATTVREYLAARGVAERDLWACELAFVEGCNNAVQNTPANYAGKKLVVKLSCGSTHVELRINDHTHGFELPTESRLPGPEEERGRGIFLMRTLMDEVDYIREPSSNCLVLRKARTGI
jgi:anti-sigma regulatory factor (Ser/Thr protein kinase)